MIVPNGTLFSDGVSARIKEQLLKEFNLHTIVRLPNGVFAPYTSIPTNLLFFDRSGPTKDVWYYEQPLPEGRKNYTKTQPMQFEEFDNCIGWWNKRIENEVSWKVSVEDILRNNCNLDLKNPRAKEDLGHLPPEVLVKSMMEKEERIVTYDPNSSITEGYEMSQEWPNTKLSKILIPLLLPEPLSHDKKYRLLGVRLTGMVPSFGRNIGDAIFSKHLI